MEPVVQPMEPAITVPGAVKSRTNPYDSLFASLVTALVVVDGPIGLAYLTAPPFGYDPALGRALVTVWPPLLGPTAWWSLLGVLGLAAAVAASAAAGLRSPEHAVVAIVAVPAAVLYLLTGLVLPWDQLSFWLARGLLEVVLAVPVLGDPFAGLLFGGRSLGYATLQRAFLVHYGILAVAALVVVGTAVRRGWRRYGESTGL